MQEFNTGLRNGRPASSTRAKIVMLLVWMACIYLGGFSGPLVIGLQPNAQTISGLPCLWNATILQAAQNTEPTPAARLKISLPIDEASEKAVKSGIDQALSRWEAQTGGNRPVLLLEFDTAANITGGGSKFESCLALASYLQRPQMQRIKTVAYIPPASGFSSKPSRDLNLKLQSKLAGHALLVALGCEELWMDDEAFLGGVGSDSKNSELEQVNYQLIAKKGNQWPAAVVQSLVNNTSGLYRVTKPDGKNIFADQATREDMNAQGQEVGSEEIASPGSEIQWTANSLSGWGLIQPPVVNRDDLILRLQTDQLVDLVAGENFKEWSAAILDVTQLDQDFVSWASRSIGSELLVGNTNLLFVRIDTLGGYDLQAAASLAQTIAGLDRNSIRTVALLPNGADGAETLVAMACDEIVITNDQKLGGNVSLPLGDDSLIDSLIVTSQSIALAKNRDWSLIAGLTLGNQAIFEYRNRKSGSLRLLNEKQHASLIDADDWQKQGEVSLATGLSSTEAKKRGIVDHLVDNVDAAKTLYSVDDWRTIVPTLSDRTVQRFARFLNRPGISGLLLMVGMFALMIELSAPGIGVPGFLSACCLGLFFWSHYFEGSAGALEILLFVFGVVFILLELFVVPGLGLFGIGGGLMLLLAIVLACQDFVIPRSQAQINQLGWSLTTLLAGMLGIFAAIIFIRYYMEKVPFLNRLILSPPGGGDAGLALEGVSRGAKFDYLLNRSGLTVTPLMPGGKVQFGNEVINVISDGRVIEKGVEVKVFEVSGMIIKVEPK